MAKSMDSLIEFLVGEIAANPQGLNITQLVNSISAFYDAPEKESGPDSTSNIAAATYSVAVDRALLSKVWLWLGNHPDISIGDKGRYNETTLAQVEAEFPGYVDLSFGTSTASAEARTDTGSSRQSSGTPTKQSNPRRGLTAEGPRICLKKERLYQAICGHPPDPRRVAASEFDLLAHIAATRADGILQGELVRLSGQDKRSVPKRTDALHSKGYIIKETVFYRGNRTSRLTLKKFAKSNAADAEPSQPQGSTIRHVVRRVFDVLAGQPLIPQSQLAEALNLQSPARSAVLQKVIRRLERLALVKRARTAVGPSATSNDLQYFVQLLRPAEPKDLLTFDTKSLSLDQTLEELTSSGDSGDHPSPGPIYSPAADEDGESSKVPVQSATWNPDRLMSNVLADTVQSAGRDGLTNIDARQHITGDFVRKQLEAVLYRISCESLVVQPPHLRHLAVIRHAVTEDGVTRFLHYSWDEFKQMITEQGIDISAIPGAKKLLQVAMRETNDSTDAGITQQSANIDEFGFPLQDVLPLQVKRGQATLSSIIGGTAAGDVEARKGELVVVREGAKLSLEVRNDVPGLSQTTSRAPRPPPRPQIASTPRKVTKRKRPAGDDDEEVARGRPRKYARGTEKFWRVQFKQARLAAGHDDVKAGNMRDPVAKALYARRPANFDQTLVEAMDAKLPVPISTDDINQNWIDSTRVILDRSSQGVYMSPTGLRWDSFNRLSRVMIIKTPRLASVDLSQQSVVHPWQFISSSASHSLIYRRYYPMLPAKAPHILRTPFHLKRHAETKFGSTGEKKKSGPRLGLFFEEPAVEDEPSVGFSNPFDCEMPVDLTMDSTDEDQTLLHNNTAGRRASSTISMRETMSTKQLQTSQRLDEGEAWRGSTPETAIPAGSENIQNSVLRSTRKRKLTEKAVQLLETSQGRKMRLFSETRSIASEDSAAIQTPDRTNSQDQELAMLAGIETAAAKPSPSPSLPRSTQTPVRAAITDVASNASKSSTTRTMSPPAKRTPATNKRKADSSELDEEQASAKQKYTKGANALCRKIVLELVTVSTGVAPNDHITLRRISANRWQEAGEEDRPLLKTMKTAIKSLTESGKLKSATFMFRGKSGSMVTRSVIFLPSINRSSQLVEDVKQKIKEADPVDYIPPEWNVEAARTPLFNKDAPSRTLQIEDDVEELPARVRRAPSNRATRTPAKRRRASSTASAGTIDSNVGRTTRGGSQAMPEPPPESAATGFLTLKVPALSSVPAVQLFFWRAECPVTALLSDASYANPWRDRGVAVKRRRKKKKSVDSQPPGNSLRWRDFPSSLEDILEIPNLKLEFAQCYSADTADNGPDWQYFACKQEGVRAWEHQFPDSALAKRSQYGFINHTVPEALYFRAEFPPTAQFKTLVYFDEFGKELESSYPPTESWPTFVAALQASPEEASLIAGGEGVVLRTVPPPPPPEATTPGLRRTTRKPKRKVVADNVFFDPALDEELEPAPKRHRKAAKSTKKAPNSAGPKAVKSKPLPLLTTTLHARRTRGDRWTQNMSENRVRRIVVSVVVVRALAGGMDGDIDWSIVLPLFPKSKELYLKSSWETLSNRHIAQIQALTEEFQNKYLEALEANRAPSVDFEDLHGTNWSAIVEWALKKLDRFSLRHTATFAEVDLPESRDDLLEDFELAFEEPKRYHGVVSHSLASVKEDVLKSTVFGVPTTSPTILKHDLHFEATLTNNSDLHLAKSYTLASILTPPTAFNGARAHAKLSSLSLDPKNCERLLGEALALLQSKNLIQRIPQKRHFQATVNDPSGMRTWEIHPSFLTRFESTGLISPSMLRRATTFKLSTLDPAFSANDIPFLEKGGDVSDGEMLAVFNLMGQGHVRCKPGPDVPRTRYGIDHERVGYRTRGMDKSLLGFGVELHPTQSYEFGDVMAEGRSVPVPRGGADEERGRILAWIDIHGNLNTSLWEVFLAGVLGLVSQMPGISSADSSAAFGHALEVEEVGMILAWAEQGEFVGRDEKTKGWKTREWWWLCIGGE